MKTISTADQIQQAHSLYCSLTGQTLGLGYDRERMWFELLRLGYGLEQIRQVIVYLQKEIKAQRRTVGALKLSNFLQPDRFEEDLNISRVKLRTPDATTPVVRPQILDARKQEDGRLRALECIRKMKEELHIATGSGTNLAKLTAQSEKNRQIPTDQCGETTTD